MAIVDRIRGRRDLARDAVRAVSETTDAIVERASDATTAVARAAADARDSLAAGADDLTGQAANLMERTGRDLESLFQDAKTTIAEGAAPEEIVRRIERRWPGTDTDRYDRAFQRGYARGRSGRLAVGVAVGAALAGAGAYFFDPERGVARRETLARRARELTDQARHMVEERRQAMAGGSGRSAEPRAWSSSETGVAVGPGVMTAEPEPEPLTSSGEADPRVPVAAGTVAAEGHEAGRGDWHRDLPPS